MENDTVAAEIELTPDLLHALIRTARGCGFEPFVRNQFGHSLQIRRGGRGVQRAREPADEFIFAKTFQNRRVPTVGFDQKVPVTL